MFRLSALAALAALSLMMLAGCEEEAWAGNATCGEPVATLKAWKEQYGEVPAFQGQAGDQVVTITLSPTGSWTAFATYQGMLCQMAGGDHWEAVPPPAPKAAPGSLPDAPALLKNGLILIRQ